MVGIGTLCALSETEDVREPEWSVESAILTSVAEIPVPAIESTSAFEDEESILTLLLRDSK